MVFLHKPGLTRPSGMRPVPSPCATIGAMTSETSKIACEFHFTATQVHKSKKDMDKLVQEQHPSTIMVLSITPASGVCNDSQTTCISADGVYMPNR